MAVTIDSSSGWGSYADGRHVARLSTGRLLAVVYSSTPRLEIWYSDDNGATWSENTAARAAVHANFAAASYSFTLFVDVDDNGHLAGDICLQRIAAAISGALRLEHDDVFRFGGEEFVAVLDGAALAEAAAAAERVRGAVEGVAIARGAERHGVMTVSIGVAAGVIGEGTTLGDLIAEADLALYAAKRSGRNQVRHLDQSGAGRERRVARG